MDTFHVIMFLNFLKIANFFINTAQKMEFSIKDFFSKCDQIHSYGFGCIY